MRISKENTGSLRRFLIPCFKSNKETVLSVVEDLMKIDAPVLTITIKRGRLGDSFAYIVTTESLEDTQTRSFLDEWQTISDKALDYSFRSRGRESVLGREGNVDS